MADPTNLQVAAVLDELGDLYELDGAIVHRVVAYRNAAKAIRDASVSVVALARQGRATELAGVGKTIEEKVRALADEGEIPALTRLRDKFPPGLLELTRLNGLGPKRARRLFDEAGIDSPQALRDAIGAGRVRELKGFGAKAESALLASLDAAVASPSGRVVLHRALEVGEALLAAIRALPGVEQASLAGSARRMAESVKDLDVVVATPDTRAVAAAIAGLEMVEGASTPGENAVRLRLHTGLAVDVRVVRPGQWGNLLQHLSGSGPHNVALRDFAVRRGLHISEYGVLDDATGFTRECATEEEVYALAGMDWIPPELRENRGELKAALEHTLPALVTQEDLKGDLHCHTTASDGTASIEAMAAAARDAGYEYLCITDHSASFGFGNEVGPNRLLEQIEAVRAARVDGIEVLIGSEVNILPDGSLDYADELLAQLDWVIASVHSSFQMAGETMTARIIRAVEHPYVDCVGHLTGRKIEKRPPYAVDVEAVIGACAATGTMLEINASPDRRDLSEVHARMAAAAGIPIVINTDSHRTTGFAVARYGVATARRAWLTAEQIANTRPWAEFAPLRKRTRSAQ